MHISQKALTYDDVLLVPGYSETLPKDANLTTRLTRDITLNIPLVSAAMDTVTEARMAIAMAQEGGIGIIHKNVTPEMQAQHVQQVKKFESGIVETPITVSPDTTVAELISLTKVHRISGMPVVDSQDVLVGIVTHRDWRFVTKMQKTVADIMTPKPRLVTVSEGTSRQDIMALFRQHRLEKILIVDDAFHLKGMVTVKDIQKSLDKPMASKDAQGRLRVGAAVGTAADTLARVELLSSAGVDLIVVDTAHGHSKGVIDTIRAVKAAFPHIQVIGGNIATADAAVALAKAGADGVKVGIGPGSICTTRIIAGVGVPQITAIANVAEALQPYDVPLIADGGVRYSGDIAKAIAAGASAVMVGGLLAGCDEAPGDIELYQGRSYKTYRGMGSLGAMGQEEGSSDRYFQSDTTDKEKLVPEGIEGRVPHKGAMLNVVHQLMGGLRAAMGYTGNADIPAMRSNCQFVEITHSGKQESHVHDVTIVKEAPNYHME